ncbi:MAG TPA: putative Ig domain-containing protein, partial [Deinococcales bacterium]|nr:putative Ig domain-containing protein [Deinococcales bacterium]
MHRTQLALAATLLALAGCGQQQGSGTTTGGEVLRFMTAALPPAATGEPYSQEVVLTSGSRPYNLRVVKGTLPPGVGLQGRTLTGTPTEARSFTFTLEASDANLSIVQREYTLNVTATPAKVLSWVQPPTEVRGDIRVPFRLVSPRGVTAFRA